MRDERTIDLAIIVSGLNIVLAWLICTLLVAIPAAMLLREWLG